MNEAPSLSESTLVYLENDYLKATFSCYGASLVSLIYKPLKRETVCGFTSDRDLKKQDFYLGAVVGRVANRIEEGHFTLNGVDYQLPINNGIHHLHGGTIGFNQALFECEKTSHSLVFKHHSPAFDQGYPGALDLHFSVSLNKASLQFEFDAISDSDTLSDPTLHTYFNLNADHAKSILNHHLEINSDVLYGLSDTGCTTHSQIEKTAVIGTNSLIQSMLSKSHPQLNQARGLDHYFVKKDCFIPLIRLRNEDLMLEVETSLPGCHIYSGNYLESRKDLEAPFLQKNGAICFETHHIPNSINFSLNDAPILKAHTHQKSQTIYRFKGVHDE